MQYIFIEEKLVPKLPPKNRNNIKFDFKIASKTLI